MAKTASAGIAALEKTIVVGEAADGLARFEDLLAAEKAASEPAETCADEVAFWLYSSGSTGMPKGAKHIHSSLMATAELYARPVLGITADDVCFSAAKLFFAYGLGNAHDLPDGGRRDHGVAAGAADAAILLRAC